MDMNEMLRKIEEQVGLIAHMEEQMEFSKKEYTATLSDLMRKDTDFICQLLPSEMAHQDIFVLADEVKILRSRVAELEVDIRRTKSAYDYVCWLTKQDSNVIYDKIVNGEGEL